MANPYITTFGIGADSGVCDSTHTGSCADTPPNRYLIVGKQISIAHTDVELSSAFDVLVSHMQAGRVQQWLAFQNRYVDDFNDDCK